MTVLAALANFQSSDAATRNAAREILDSQQFVPLAVQLLEAAQSHPDPSIRCLACVILRSKAEKLTDDKLSRIEDEVREIGQRALDLLGAEGSPPDVQRQILYVLSTLNDKVHNGQWSALWDLVTCAVRDELCPPVKRSYGLQLLPVMLEEMSTLDMLAQVLQDVAFTSGLQGLLRNGSLHDKVSVCKMLSSFTDCVLRKQAENRLVRLVAGTTAVPSKENLLTTGVTAVVVSCESLLIDLMVWMGHHLAVSKENEKHLIDTLSYMNEMTAVQPKLFAGQSDVVLPMLKSLVQLGPSHYDVARLAVQLFFSVATAVMQVFPSLLDTERELVLQLSGGVANDDPDFACDSEWQSRSERDLSGDYSGDSLFSAMWDALYEQVRGLSGVASNVEQALVEAALAASARTAAQQVAMLRVVEAVVAGAKTKTETAFLRQLLPVLIGLLKQKLGIMQPEESRVRWVLMYVIGEILDAVGWTFEEMKSILLPLIELLAVEVLKDVVVRCRCRALTTLFLVFTSLAHGFDGGDDQKENVTEIRAQVDTFTRALLEQVVVPSIQSGNAEQHAAAFSVMGAILRVSSQAAQHFYADVLGAAVNVVGGAVHAMHALSAPHALRASGGAASGGAVRDASALEELKDVMAVTDSAVGAAAGLIADCDGAQAASGNAPNPNVALFVDKVLTLFERAVEYSQSDKTIAAEMSAFHPSLLQALVTVLPILPSSELPTWVDRFFKSLAPLMMQSDALVVSQDSEGRPTGLTTKDLTLMSMYSGPSEVEGGIERIRIPQADGCDKVIEISTSVVDDKKTALIALQDALPHLGTVVVPYIPQLLTMLEANLQSVALVNSLAMLCMDEVLACLLPKECDTAMLPYEQLQSALTAGLISVDDYDAVAVRVLRAICARKVTLTQAGHIVGAVNDVIQTLTSAIDILTNLQMKPLPSFRADAPMLGVICDCLSRALTIVVADDIQRQQQSEHRSGSPAGPGPSAAQDADNDDDGTDSSGSDLDERSVPGLVSLVLRYLYKMFDPSVVSKQFVSNFNAPMSSLLRLGSAESKAAALYTFGAATEFGDRSQVGWIVKENFEVALKQDLTDSVTTQAFVYYMGEMARNYPEYWEPHRPQIMTMLSTLLQDEETGREALECTAGALVKIFFNENIKTHGISSSALSRVMERVWPFTEDSDESSTIGVMFIKMALEQHPAIVKDTEIRVMVSNCLKALQQRLAESNQDSTYYQCLPKAVRVSGKLQEAIAIIDHRA